MTGQYIQLQSCGIPASSVPFNPISQFYNAGNTSSMFGEAQSFDAEQAKGMLLRNLFRGKKVPESLQSTIRPSGERF